MLQLKPAQKDQGRVIKSYPVGLYGLNANEFFVNVKFKRRKAKGINKLRRISDASVNVMVLHVE